MANTTNADERRQYLRIEAAGLSLVYEEIAPEALDLERRRVLSNTQTAGNLTIETDRLWHNASLEERLDNQFADMSRMMSQIDAKLDYLIAVAEGRKPSAAYWHTVFLVDISGAGVGFLSDKALDTVQFLKLRIQISRFPLNEINVIGKVAWCRVAENPGTPLVRYEVGIQFDSIHEDDRERIFRFISRVERKMLRDRKDART